MLNSCRQFTVLIRQAHKRKDAFMNKRISYSSTVSACYIGYVCQAAVNNLAPLLFIIFQTRYSMSYDKISMLILINFITQLLVDLSSVKLSKHMSVRSMTILAHIMCAAGLIMMGTLPLVAENTFTVLILSVIVYAVGGGLTEVLISPIIEAIPDTAGSAKAAAMSLLHSFYCWGQVAVVLLSTGFLAAFGENLWFLLPVIWAILPIFNAIFFTKVPLAPSLSENNNVKLSALFKQKGFVLILILMLCAGASELAMSQWSSLFAQKGLMISKSLGDLLGPCLFAVLMGTGRALYAVFANKISLYKIMTASGILCIVCYIIVAFSDVSALSLSACALCGLSVAVMWPGTFSLAAAKYKSGGTAMYSLMALAGDLGCASGPFIAGMICNFVTASGADESSGMKTGLGFSVLFPVILVICTLVFTFIVRKRKAE